MPRGLSISARCPSRVVKIGRPALMTLDQGRAVAVPTTALPTVGAGAQDARGQAKFFEDSSPPEHPSIPPPLALARVNTRGAGESWGKFWRGGYVSIRARRRSTCTAGARCRPRPGYRPLLKTGSAPTTGAGADTYAPSASRSSPRTGSSLAANRVASACTSTLARTMTVRSAPLTTSATTPPCSPR